MFEKYARNIQIKKCPQQNSFISQDYSVTENLVETRIVPLAMQNVG